MTQDIKTYIQSRIDQLQSEAEGINRNTYNAGWLEGTVYNLKEMLKGIDKGDITL